MVSWIFESLESRLTSGFCVTILSDISDFISTVDESGCSSRDIFVQPKEVPGWGVRSRGELKSINDYQPAMYKPAMPIRRHCSSISSADGSDEPLGDSYCISRDTRLPFNSAFKLGELEKKLVAYLPLFVRNIGSYLSNSLWSQWVK